MLLALPLLIAASPPVKFSADQCRVLKQLRIDTKGMCDAVKPKPRKSVASR